MKQVAAENNLVALNELIQTAESVLGTNYKEELSKQVRDYFCKLQRIQPNFTKEDLIKILTDVVIKSEQSTNNLEEEKDEGQEEFKTPQGTP